MLQFGPLNTQHEGYHHLVSGSNQKDDSVGSDLPSRFVWRARSQPLNLSLD